MIDTSWANQAIVLACERDYGMKVLRTARSAAGRGAKTGYAVLNSRLLAAAVVGGCIIFGCRILSNTMLFVTGFFGYYV